MLQFQRILAASALCFVAWGAGCSSSVTDGSTTQSGNEQAASSSCAHSICTAGTKLSKTCDPCVTKICDSDSYCCKTKWDSECVGEVATICDETCGGSPDLRSGSPDLRSGSPDLRSGGPDLSNPNPDLSSGGGGSVGPGGGTVPSLFFAVVGDTRPPNVDDTAGYPTAIIQKIFSDIEGMSPRPQFVVATGDYQFATSTGTAGAPQVALYAQAAKEYSGTLFAAMGNHECDGYTADNCTANTNNYNAYASNLLQPLGKTLPYYSIPINATDGSWTAKLLIVACNYWSSAQQTWLTNQLATSTTYTFVARHEPASATTAPCVSEVESLLAANPYNLSLVGHTHHFQANGKEIIVGNGGAPLSGGTYGYTTVQQTAAGFVVTDYDYSTAMPVSSTTVPF